MDSNLHGAILAFACNHQKQSGSKQIQIRSRALSTARFMDFQVTLIGQLTMITVKWYLIYKTREKTS